MKAVFAPWRMEFLAGKKEKGCVFCNRINRKKDRPDLILYRGKYSFVILNKYPYNSGHLMVVPNRHIASFEILTPEERCEIFDLLAKTEGAIRRAMKPQGFNIGANLGKAGGAGIEDHLHFHVIPRWLGDTNFWPVISETKSMPLHLRTTYDLLKKHWR